VTPAASLSRRAQRAGFTLIELLVVIAIIGVLLSILLPSLRAVRESAKTVVCLANQRTMGQAFVVYANDSHDVLVSPWTDSRTHPGSWTDWPKTLSGAYLTGAQLAAAQDTEPHFRGVRDGALFPYIQTHEVYHCPSDGRDEFRTNSGSNLAWVTYSLPNYLHGDAWWERQNGGDDRPVRRYFELHRPSENFTFLEESDPRGLNMGAWVMRLDRQEWIDPLSIWHDKRATVGFADGHAAVRRWEDARTIGMSQSQQFYASASDNADYDWMRARWGNP
jgi:prepilin-type N-terminal cleavage/methylation domain-containing protein/prepilin-type processing-associated H-X9-DG protein